MIKSLNEMKSFNAKKGKTQSKQGSSPAQT